MANQDLKRERISPSSKAPLRNKQRQERGASLKAYKIVKIFVILYAKLLKFGR
jgi:hypothetical protein